MIASNGSQKLSKLKAKKFLYLRIFIDAKLAQHIKGLKECQKAKEKRINVRRSDIIEIAI